MAPAVLDYNVGPEGGHMAPPPFDLLRLVIVCIFPAAARAGGPVSHGAHVEALARIDQLEATVVTLLDALNNNETRRLQTMGINASKMNEGHDMLGSGMEHGSMASMHASLFFFAGPPEKMVVVWDGWQVSSWPSYFGTLVVLLVWAVAHESLADVRAAFMATAPGQRLGCLQKTPSDGLGMSLTGRHSQQSLPGVTVATASPLNEADAAPTTEAPATLVVRVGGMTCDGCATRIQSVLSRCSGVLNVDVAYARGTAIVHFDSALVRTDELLSQFVDMGYDAEDDTAAVKQCLAPCSIIAIPAAGPDTTTTVLTADGSPAAPEWRFMHHLVALDNACRRSTGVGGALSLALLVLQLGSTYLLMLATMTFEVGVITAVVSGRAAGNLWVATRRRAPGEGDVATPPAMECCTL